MKNLKKYLAYVLILFVSFSCIEQGEEDKFTDEDMKLISLYVEIYEDNKHDIPLVLFMKLFKNEVENGNYLYTNEDAFEYYIELFIKLNADPIYFPEKTIREYFLMPNWTVEFNPLEMLHNEYTYYLDKEKNIKLKTEYFNKIGEIKYPFIPFIETHELYLYYKSI